MTGRNGQKERFSEQGINVSYKNVFASLNYRLEFLPRTFRDVRTYVPKGACVEKRKIVKFCPKGTWGAKRENTTATRVEAPKLITDKNTSPYVPKGTC